MKDWLYPLIRIVCILLTGVLFIVYRDTWANLLVILIGALFAVYGLVAVIAYFVRKSRKEPAGFVPVLGFGCVLLGLVLMLKSKSFVQTFVYVAAALLIILAISHIVRLVMLHRHVKLSGWFFLAPAVALVLAALALWNPMKAAAIPFVLTGVGCIISAVSDTLGFVLFRRRQKLLKEQAESLEEESEEPITINIDNAQ
ncbi:MAG: DUF308 domain-containing protein [Bacteroidaceae bacterium]|nr:DUF308 domain-containing protein [Bacteroidaceae bacterium]MBR5964173.1 DUF308 domain-containing protein [Bacteroidaceae bacterium]